MQSNESAPLDEHADLWGLRVGKLHVHDSRPGSWCILVGRKDSKRLDYHLQYDPHATNPKHRTVYRRDWIADAWGNCDALAVIAYRTARP